MCLVVKNSNTFVLFVKVSSHQKYGKLLPKLYVMPHIIGYKNHSELIPGEWKCSDGWNYIEGICYRLVTSQNNITEEYSCNEANQACMNLNGTLADINSVKDIILSYLNVKIRLQIKETLQIQNYSANKSLNVNIDSFECKLW